MCNVNSMCEFLCSSSVVLGPWLLWRAAMAASRNQAAFSGVGARSSDWFWSWKMCGKGKKSVNIPHVDIINKDRETDKRGGAT